jgi:m7GpppX diphosphatase
MASSSEPSKKPRRPDSDPDAASVLLVNQAGSVRAVPESMDVNSSSEAAAAIAASFNGDPQKNALDLTSHHPDQPSSGSSIHTESPIRMPQIKFVRTLSDNAQNKLYAYEGLYNEKPAVVVLEKTQMSEASVKELIEDPVPLEVDFVNDVYGAYAFHPNSSLNGIKATIIHPANAKHIDKWMRQEVRLLLESADQYRNITLPFIGDHQLKVEWVHNILDGKKEAERIILNDPDPDIGFILLPDLKWDQSTMNDLYLQAICHKRDIRSLRDLTADHLPLLQNILSKGCQSIREKYGLCQEQLRIFIHYQPSYYHFHVHFTALSHQVPGSYVERAHLLSTVIQNISLIPDYYQRSSLSFVVKVTDPLYKLFRP